MKKTLIIVFLFCAATMLTGLRTGFAFDDYGPANCKTCHEGAATVHAQHGDPLPACNLCHVEGQDTPKPSKCVVCHPAGNPGTCPLVYVHEDKGASCLSCHASDCPCPPDTPPEVVTFDKNGDCLLNKEELKDYSSTLKIDQSAEKTALKTKQTLEKDKYKAIKVNFSN